MIHNHSQMFPGHIFRDGILFMAWSVILSVYGVDPITEVKVFSFQLNNQLQVGFQAPVFPLGLTENSSQE
jgi:hypothetical protein